jgi:hypothetical protein
VADWPTGHTQEVFQDHLYTLPCSQAASPQLDIQAFALARCSPSLPRSRPLLHFDNSHRMAGSRRKSTQSAVSYKESRW